MNELFNGFAKNTARIMKGADIYEDLYCVHFH